MNRRLIFTAATVTGPGVSRPGEIVPNEDRISPPMAARFSLTMLSNTPQGDAYTFGDLNRMLLDAGFRDATLHDVPGPHSVVLGVK